MNILSLQIVYRWPLSLVFDPKVWKENMSITALKVSSVTCLHCWGQSWLDKKETRKESKNDNKKAANHPTNPPVKESGLLQQFLYAVSIPQGDKHNAEPASSNNLTNTANTEDYLIICLLTRLNLLTNTFANVT